MTTTNPITWDNLTAAEKAQHEPDAAAGRMIRGKRDPKPTTFILTTYKGDTAIFHVRDDEKVVVTIRTANYLRDESLGYRETLDGPAARRKYRELVRGGYSPW